MVKKKPIKEIIVSLDYYETRAATLEEGSVVEVFIERHDRPSLVGNVYKGRVKNVLPGMEAAFVDIGIDKNAFLHVGEVVIEDAIDLKPVKIQHLLKSGQEVLVQITKDPMSSKGARVSTQISLPGRYLVLLPFSDFVGVSRRLEETKAERLRTICQEIKPKEMGIIARTASEKASRDDLERDLLLLKKLWRDIFAKAGKIKPPSLVYQERDLALRIVRDVFSADFKRLIVDNQDSYNKIVSYLHRVAPDLEGRVQLYQERIPLFDKYSINEAIKEALERKVWLRSGGYIAIDQNEALTAIDVNTGKYVGKTSLEDTILKTNLEAAKEVVRQLRLRDIGGIIVIDFIDMENPDHQEKVFGCLSKALAEDRTKSRVIEVSQLGLVEMTRKNISDGLLDVLTETCPCCDGKGKKISPKTLIIEAVRKMEKMCLKSNKEALLIKTSPEFVTELLADKKRILRKMQQKTGKRIYLKTGDNLNLGEVASIKEGTIKEIEKLAKDFTSAK